MFLVKFFPIIREDTLLGFPGPFRRIWISFPFDKVFQFSSGKLGIHDFFDYVFFFAIYDDGRGRRWTFL